MLIVKKASEIPPLSDDDIKQIREACSRPIVDDDDCPQTTDAEFMEFMAKHFDKTRDIGTQSEMQQKFGA